MHCHLAIVGGGAAGLATAIFAARSNPALSIHIFDGAKKLGAKILVSGGGRCNVTNQVVRSADYWGGSRRVINRIIDELPVDATIAFFRELGVELHEEENGKLFPDTNEAKSILDALLNEAHRLNVQIHCSRRVTDVATLPDSGFRIATSSGEFSATALVLATGGLALPRTGSDGGGYALARALGHSIVPTTPALAPLILDGDFHVPLAGLTHTVEICLRVDGEKPERIAGSMLWAHFGISGPAAMNASRVWNRAKLEGKNVEATINFLPGEGHQGLDKFFVDASASQPRSTLRRLLASRLPERLCDAILARLGISGAIQLSQLRQFDRRKLVAALLAWPLPVRDSRGYAHAEATAGGVPLSEVHAATLESRRCPGLYLVGEILDVDGRIGGFNFQWAWSGGFVAGRAAARRFKSRASDG